MKIHSDTYKQFHFLLSALKKSEHEFINSPVESGKSAFLNEKEEKKIFFFCCCSIHWLKNSF